MYYIAKKKKNEREREKNVVHLPENRFISQELKTLHFINFYIFVVFLFR